MSILRRECIPSIVLRSCPKPYRSNSHNRARRAGALQLRRQTRDFRLLQVVHRDVCVACSGLTVLIRYRQPDACRAFLYGPGGVWASVNVSLSGSVEPLSIETPDAVHMPGSVCVVTALHSADGRNEVDHLDEEIDARIRCASRCRRRPYRIEVPLRAGIAVVITVLGNSTSPQLAAIPGATRSR